MSNEFADSCNNARSAPYEMTLEARESYLYACVHADYVDLGIAVSYINDLISYVRTTHQRKILLVRETPPNMSPMEHSFAASVLLTLIPKNKKLAVVDSPSSYEVVKEVVMMHHERHPLINAFDSVEDAKSWLLAA